MYLKIKHLRLHVVAFLLMLSPLNALAESDCVLSGRLQGDPRHFWLWGRDSFVGTGTLVCVSGSSRKSSRRVALNSAYAEPIVRLVSIRYSPWGPGIGAGQYNELIFESHPFGWEKAAFLYGTYRSLSQKKDLVLGIAVSMTVELGPEAIQVTLRDPSGDYFKKTGIENLLGPGLVTFDSVKESVP